MAENEMPRIPINRPIYDPRRRMTFLDSCAFNPIDPDQAAAAKRILELRESEEVKGIHITHSVEREIDHPNTPGWVKDKADDMGRTFQTAMTDIEADCFCRLWNLITGNGTPEKYQADATHVFLAGKFGGAFFVTADNRILHMSAELSRISGAIIVTPCEWIQHYDRTAERGALG